MTDKNVVLFTKPACAQCNATKRWLDKNKVAFTSVDITQDDEARDRVIGLGYSAAPVVEITGEDHWSGYRETKLEEHFRNNELKGA